MKMLVLLCIRKYVIILIQQFNFKLVSKKFNRISRRVLQ